MCHDLLNGLRASQCGVQQLLLVTHVAAGLLWSTEVPLSTGSEALCDAFRDKKD